MRVQLVKRRACTVISVRMGRGTNSGTVVSTESDPSTKLYRRMIWQKATLGAPTTRPKRRELGRAAICPRTALSFVCSTLIEFSGAQITPHYSVVGQVHSGNKSRGVTKIHGAQPCNLLGNGEVFGIVTCLHQFCEVSTTV